MVHLTVFLSPIYSAQSALDKDLARSRILEYLDSHSRLAVHPYEKTSLDELVAYADQLLVRIKATHASDSSEPSSVSSTQKMINELFESRLDGIDRILSQQSTPANSAPFQSRGMPNPLYSHLSNSQVSPTQAVQHSPLIFRLPNPPPPPNSAPVRSGSLCHYHQRFGSRAFNYGGPYSPMFSTMHQKTTERQGVETRGTSWSECPLFFVYERRSNTPFVVDTGAACSLG